MTRPCGRFVKTLLIASVAIVLQATGARAVEPIEGTWKRDDGTLIQYTSAGDGQFCGIVVNTSFQGQSIGCMAGSGAKYEGEINKLDVGKTYKGKAEMLDANTLKLTGCALGGIVCRSEDLARQETPTN